MKAYLINPLTRSIEELEYDGTVLGIGMLFPYNTKMLEVSMITTKGDSLLHMEGNMAALMAAMDPERMSKDYGTFGVRCGKCKTIHPMFGKAIIVGRDEASETDAPDDIHLRDPSFKLADAYKAIGWGRFEQVSLEEAQAIERGEIPDRFKQEEVMDSKAVTIAGLELARITSQIN